MSSWVDCTIAICTRPQNAPSALPSSLQPELLHALLLLMSTRPGPLLQAPDPGFHEASTAGGG